MKSALRPWQQRQLDKFRASKKPPVWTSVVCTGAGKTLGTLALVEHVWKKGDLVIVVVPGVEVRRGWADDATQENRWKATETVENYDSSVDLIAVTYQLVAGADRRLLSHLTQRSKRRVILILDEIHRIAEDSEDDGAPIGKWAEAIRDLVEETKPAHTFLLTATPWRESTQEKLPFAEYDVDGIIQSDFSWSYAEELLTDAPCVVTLLAPTILATADRVDLISGKAEEVSTLEDGPLTPFVRARSMTEFLSKPNLAVHINEGIAHLRNFPPEAKMLVVAESISSARTIHTWLGKTGARSLVITSKDVATVEQFRKGDIQIAVAVGKIAEGVNVPAIKVVVLLTNITRRRALIQLFGRALRRCDPKTLPSLGLVDEAHVVIFANKRILDVVASLFRDDYFKVPIKKKGDGAGEIPNGTPASYRDFDASRTGVITQQKNFSERSALQADFIQRTAGITYAAALLVSEDCLHRGVLYPGYVEGAAVDIPAGESHDEEMARKKTEADRMVTMLALRKMPPGGNVGESKKDINTMLAYNLKSRGLRPKTAEYKDARYSLLVEKTHGL